MKKNKGLFTQEMQRTLAKWHPSASQALEEPFWHH